MSSIRPWFKFFPSDWESDERLKLCSLSAQGLWIRCMCIMHKAEPYGHLIIGGQPVTNADLGILIGTSEDQIAALLNELESRGVLSRNRHKVIYSRRMTRDEKRAKSSRRNGSRGGNPSLCNDKGIKPRDNPVVNLPVNTKDNTQSPESRVQKEKTTNVVSLDSTQEKAEPAPKEIAERMVEIWNACMHKYQRSPSRLTGKRTKKLVTRFRQDFGGDYEKWRDYCSKFAASPFLRGDKTDFKADLTWAIDSEDRVTVVMEGRYDNKGQGGDLFSKSTPPRKATGQAW